MRMLALVVGLCCSMSLDLNGASYRPVSFRLRGVADIVVSVSIGGAGPFQFLLDTGSSRSAISAKTASKLGLLEEVAQTLMVTPTGRGQRGMVRIERFEFGPVKPPPLAMMVLPAADLGRGIDGLIGQDVLGALKYTIDYPHRRLLWHADDISGDSRRLRLEWDSGRFFVALPQASGPCKVLRVVPDSGTDGFVIFAQPSRPIPSFRLLDVGMLGTLSGDRFARTVVLEDVHVGDVRLREQRALLIETPSSNSSFGDGLLPLHLFSRVAFNGPERYLMVEGTPVR